MPRTLYLDCFAGISGDMTIAALLHAGAPLDRLLAILHTLPLEGWRAYAEPVHRGPFACTRFVVAPVEVPVGVPSKSAEDLDHSHSHGHDHAHAHAHGAAPDTFANQPQRPWKVIRAMLEAAPALPPRARDRALRAFERLAEAEGRVHGFPAEEVTFHEVGGVDSIVDIVGACVAMELLDVDHIVASPLPMGGGSTASQHGRIPLPAPATLEVLTGYPVVPSAHPGEHVTPTGAALVAALAESGPLPAMRVSAIGYGAGTRNPASHPNVLRVVLGEGAAGAVAEVVELEAQVDDLPGELVPGLIAAILEAGALDVTCTPTLMKKGRPGFLVRVVAEPQRRVVVGDALLRHGGTFGYRYSVRSREVLARRWETVETPFGPVRLKVGERGDERFHVAPEFEDCAAAARAAGVPLGEVYRAALAAAAALD